MVSKYLFLRFSLQSLSATIENILCLVLTHLASESAENRAELLGTILITDGLFQMGEDDPSEILVTEFTGLPR